MNGMGMGTIIYFVVILGLMYFLIIRPQRKRQKEHTDMMAGMAVGDEAVTIGGLHGVIDEIDEAKNTVTLNCEGIYLEFDRRAIARTQKADPSGSKAVNDAVSDAAEEQAHETETTDKSVETEQEEVELYTDDEDINRQ